jgi:hypothetical protein
MSKVFVTLEDKKLVIKRGGRMSIPAVKCNVAWFKLAECVSRGEKERALGVYRLLSHSLDDRGVASQLEGDLLYAFGDKVMAKNRYDRALAWYKQDSRLLEMATVAQQMHVLCPQESMYLEMLIDIYLQRSVKPKLVLYLPVFISVLTAKNEWDTVIHALDRSEELFSIDVVLSLRQQFVSEVLKSEHEVNDLVMQQIYKIVDGLLMCADGDMRLQQFLSSVQALDGVVYERVCVYCGYESK